MKSTVTTSEAASLLGVSLVEVRRLVRLGILSRVHASGMGDKHTKRGRPQFQINMASVQARLDIFADQNLSGEINKLFMGMENYQGFDLGKSPTTGAAVITVLLTKDTDMDPGIRDILEKKGYKVVTKTVGSINALETS